MIERRRLPSTSYYSPSDECWSRDIFADQPVAITGAQHRDAVDVARHVANNQGATQQPFFVMDIPSVVRRVDEWRERLPHIEPFFALECNADPVLARLLSSHAQIGFYARTLQELDMALMLVDASRVVFSCELFTRKVMRLAGQLNVGTIIIESEKQLMDAVSYSPESRLLLSSSIGEVVEEDGETLDDILMTAFELRANVAGVSFNLKSGSDSSLYYKAMHQTKCVFESAKRCGLHMDTICVGGGFTNDKRKFNQTCDDINAGLCDLFPRSVYPHLKVLATPGRYFASSAFVLCTNVIAKQSLDARYVTNDDFDEGEAFVYQTNDSIYGSFQCRMRDLHPSCKPLHNAERDESLHFGTILGERLDTVDVAQQLVRCRQLNIGEWLLWENMGAYSMPLDADYAVPPVYYYSGKENWDRITGKCFVSCDDASDASDAASDVSSNCDGDDFAECFDRVFDFAY